MKKQTYDLEERLLEFSVRIIKIVEQLPNTRVVNHIKCLLLDLCFLHSMLDVQCSMFDVHHFIQPHSAYITSEGEAHDGL